MGGPGQLIPDVTAESRSPEKAPGPPGEERRNSMAEDALRVLSLVEADYFFSIVISSNIILQHKSFSLEAASPWGVSVFKLLSQSY